MDDNCHVEPVQKIASAEERQLVETALLAVWGMGCPNCAARVRNKLLTLNGVVNAYVDHAKGLAAIAYNPDLATVDLLISAVTLAGNDGRHEYGARLLGSEVLK